MLDLIHKMFSKESSGSKEIAKERLRLVLVHDRINFSPQVMDILKEDMVRVISNYMEVNEKDMEINLTQTKSSVALVASVPISRMKRGAVPGE